MQQASPASVQSVPEPHQVTREAFVAIASATELTNHGRRWNVVYADKYFAFSDEVTAEAALADVHRAAVNNALYMNLPDVKVTFGSAPALPPAEVLAQYPALLARFPELGLCHLRQSCRLA